MSYLVAIFLSVLTVELFFRLPLLATARNVLAASRNSMRVIKSKHIPDEKKQKFLLAYSLQSFVYTVMLTLHLGIILLTVLGSFWLAGETLEIDVVLYDPIFLLLMTTASTLYAILRKRVV